MTHFKKEKYEIYCHRNSFSPWPGNTADRIPRNTSESDEETVDQAAVSKTSLCTLFCSCCNHILVNLIEIWIGFYNAYLNKDLMARIQEYLATLEKRYIRQWFASVQILLHE